MREAMLVVHFLGLALGVGTSFGFMFLGIAGSKLEQDERAKFAINSSALGRMGHIGLALLIISGGYLMTPFWGALTSLPLLMAKLAMVLILIVLVTLAGIGANKAKKGDAMAELKKIAVIGRLTLLTGVAIIILAVLVFR